MAEGINKVVLLGNLTEDPQTRQTNGGQQVTTLRLATNERYQDKDKNWKDRVEYHRVTLWGNRSVLQYLTKGKQVYVEGQLRTSSYDKDGQKVYKTEVNATNVLLLGGRPDGERSSAPKEEPSSAPPDDDDIPF